MKPPPGKERTVCEKHRQKEHKYGPQGNQTISLKIPKGRQDGAEASRGQGGGGLCTNTLGEPATRAESFTQLSHGGWPDASPFSTQ